MTTRHVPPPCICKLMPASRKATALLKYIKAPPHNERLIRALVAATLAKDKP